MPTTVLLRTAANDDALTRAAAARAAALLLVRTENDLDYIVDRTLAMAPRSALSTPWCAAERRRGA